MSLKHYFGKKLLRAFDFVITMNNIYGLCLRTVLLGVQSIQEIPLLVAIFQLETVLMNVLPVFVTAIV